MNSQKPFFTLLGIVPAFGLFALSFKLSALAHRAFLFFVPYMIILFAAGVWAFFEILPLRYLASAGLVLIFVFGAKYICGKSRSSRDYKGIAQIVLPIMRTDDRVPVRNRYWRGTPLYYYLLNVNSVNKYFSEALSAGPDSRVWLIARPRECALLETDDRQFTVTKCEKIGLFRAQRACTEMYVNPSLDNR